MSQHLRHVSAQEGFEDREAAAEQSEVEFNRAERALAMSERS